MLLTLCLGPQGLEADQVKTLESACVSLNPLLTPEEAGKIVKDMWKENQVEGARTVMPYCHDAAGFRKAMQNGMWSSEFAHLGI